MSKVERSKVRAYGINVHKEDSKHPHAGDYIEAKQWTNLDGYDFQFFRHKRTDGTITVSLTFEEIEALYKLTKNILKDET